MTPEERRKLQEWAEQEEASAETETPSGRGKESWYEDLGEGVVSSGLNTVYGIKDLFTDLTEDEKLMMMDWEEDAGQSNWGTAGRVLGELGQLAIPGGAAVKGARALSAAGKAAKTARALPLATDVLASAAHGGAQYAEPDESRLMNAAQGGAFAGGGALLGKALRPLTGRSMINTSKEADALMDRGVYLTPGQAATSPAVRGAEAVAEVTPFIARGTKAARARGNQEWADQALKEVLPARLRDRVTEGGFEGVTQVRKAIDDGYDDAWGSITDLPSLRLPERIVNRLGKKDRRVVKNVLEDINLLRAGGGDVTGRQVDEIIRASMPAQAGKRELRDALDGLRQGYRSALPPERRAKLAEMDKAWPKYMAVRRAAKNAAKEGGEMTPGQLLQGSSVIGKDALAGHGMGPLQQYGMMGEQTIGKKIGGQPLEWFRRVAGITPTPAPMQTMGQIMLGRTGVQRGLAEGLRRPTEALSPYISPARLSAAIDDEEEL